MIRYQIPYKCIQVILTLYVCLVSFDINSQNTSEYKGKYVINDTLEGNVNLTYYIQSKDTLLHGDFEFSKVFKLNEKNNAYRAIEYYGEFKENKKNKKWVFSQKELKPNNQYQIDQLNISSKADGSATFIYANFNDGEAVDEWKQIKYAFENSTPTDTLYVSNSNFNRGELAGEYYSKSENLIVSGYFTNGLMDKTWTFETDEFKEIRTFEEGVLVNISFEFPNEDEIDTTNVEFIGFDKTYTEDDSEENWEVIELNETYFEIFENAEIKISEETNFKYQNSIKNSIKKSNQFIYNSFKSYTHVDDFEIWNNIRGSKKINLPKVKIRKIKFKEEEKDFISKIQENYQNANEKIALFSEHEKLEIGKLNFKELNKVEKIFQIYQNKLTDLENVYEIIAKPSFEFLIRDEVLQINKIKLNFPGSVTYDYDGEKVTEDYTFPDVEGDEFNLELISSLLTQINQDIEKLEEETESIFEDLRKQESLSENEELLISKKSKVKELFSEDENEEYNKYHDYFSNSIIKKSETIVSDYSKLDLDIKKEEIEDFIECLDQFIQFNDDLIEFEEQVERIDDEYTRVVFNPYLMSDISERVKERVFDAYEDYLLPFVLRDLRKNIDCESITSKKENLTIIYEAMLKIRNTDTKEEERNLRRVKDVDKILSILKIELN